MRYERWSEVDATAEELFAWHERPRAFERLNPPWSPVTVLAREGQGLAVGVRVTLKVPPFPAPWVTVHTACSRPSGFVDELERGPVRSWRHEHRFEDHRLGDIVTFEPLLGVGGGLVARRLDPLFRFRHRRTALDLARHAPHRGQPRLKVAITGVTGLLGSELRDFLVTGGHEVVPISRSSADPSGPSGPASPSGSSTGWIRWDPERGEIDADALEGVDAVVHLAGESIATRWTDERKERIRRSRIGSTELLVRTFAALKRPPKVFLCGSAVGLYGDRGDERLGESASVGEGFLAEVARDWEAAAQPARDLGIRVVNLRTGLVLSARGGLLKALLPAARAGGGGPLGGGQQWQPWIAIDDWVGAVHALLWSGSGPGGIDGPVNLVAPEPVRQVDLARALGRVLRRPAFLPTPAAAVTLAMGAEAARELALWSQRVVPERLLGSGFRFEHPELEEALRFELGGLNESA